MIGLAAYPRYQRTDLTLALALHMPAYFDNWRWAVGIRQRCPNATIILRPDMGNDPDQFDDAADPTAEARRFADRFIKPRLAVVPSGTYNGVTGPCETWASSHDKNKLDWRAAFEIALCRIVQGELRLDYVALSCPVGNLEPDDVYRFADVFREARWVSYHAYLGPQRVSLAEETDPWYLWRPTRLWLPKLRELGIKLRLLCTEVGTYYPPGIKLSREGLAQLDVQIDAALDAECAREGVEYDGSLPFGFGLEGEMGNQWNLDGYERYFEGQAVPPIVPPPEPPQPPTPEEVGMLPGIDVSSNNGQIDWSEVARAGVKFALVKASEGATYVNPQFQRDRQEAKAAGLALGFYHYALPDENGAEAEADHFLRTVGHLEAGEVVALDVETGSGNLAAWTLAWLRRVESRVGFKPLLYSGRWFMRPHGLEGVPELAEYGLWLAAWQTDWPACPSPWPFVAIWQHSAKGTVPGIASTVDLDWFNGTLEQFKRYGAPAEPAASAVDIAKLTDALDEVWKRLDLIETTVGQLRAQIVRVKIATRLQ